MGLSDAENLAGLRLCESALLYDAVDLQREMGFELFAFRIGETQVSKHVAAALFECHSFFILSCHCQLLLCRLSCWASAGLRWISFMSFRGVAMPLLDFFWKACK